MPYGDLTPISIAATAQSYTASARLGLKQAFCLNNGVTPTISNIQVQQLAQAPTVQSTTGTTTTFWFAITGTLSYVPVGCSQEIQVPFKIMFKPISFTGTAGQIASVVPTAGVPQVVNSIVCNNCVNAVSVAIPVTFTATLS